jgi:hypothetical protein
MRTLAARAAARERRRHVGAAVETEAVALGISGQALRKALSGAVFVNSAGGAFLMSMRRAGLYRAPGDGIFPYLKEIRMNKRSIAVLLSSLLLAGGAAAQVNPTTPKDRSDHGSGHSGSTKKGPSGVTRDGDVPSVNRRSDASGSPGATNNSDRLAAPSGASSSGATGTGSGNSGMESGSSRQPGSGLKSSGSAGSAAGSGASDAAGSGGMGGGTTGGTMR